MIRFQDAEVIVIDMLIAALEQFDANTQENTNGLTHRELVKLSRAVEKMHRRLTKFKTTIERRDADVPTT